LVAEVKHECRGRRPSVDEEEEHRCRNEGKDQRRAPDGGSHQPGTILTSLHCRAAQKEETDHQESIRK